jgi:hypothetical protein
VNVKYRKLWLLPFKRDLNLFFIPREESGLRVFERKMLLKIIRSKRKEESG